MISSPMEISSQKDSQEPIYLPGLNGLRAIAAMAVVISHITLALGIFGLDNTILGTDKKGVATGLDLAANGVIIFFTLSGFLITYLLLKEKEISTIKIKNFYIRRILRIWPLYYLYFFLCLATFFIFHIDFPGSSVPFYIFLAANIPFILDNTLPFLAHYWSLGTEEQFYLFYPQIAKRSNKKLLKIISLLILGFLLLKGIAWLILKQYGNGLPLLVFDTIPFDAMLIGAASALLFYKKNDALISITTHTATQIICWVCIFLIALNKFHVASVINTEIVSVISVFLIIGQITQKKIINLENKVFSFIGKISYGIYVIHPLLIFYSSKILGRFKSGAAINYIIVYFLVISTTILLAYLSYEFYEKKFLRMKLKFTTVKTSAAKEGI